MKRFAQLVVSLVTAITMVTSTFPCAAFAEEALSPNDSVTYETAEVTDGGATTGVEANPSDESTGNAETTSGLSTSDSAGTDPAAGTDSVGNSENATDTSATDEATLTTVEVDAEDLFTSETYTEAIDLATADGESVTSAAETAEQRILAGYAACSESVSFKKEENITYADLCAAIALAWANPEYYWASSQCNISYYDADKDGTPDDDEIVGGVYLSYYFSASELPTVKQATETKIAEALSWIDEDEMSAFEAAQALHDYLVRNCVYDLSAATTSTPTIAHSAYGALVNSKAVCQGYALAYKLLLARVGIPVVYVQSDAMNHAWNMVQMDGNWYHVDVTWDDPVYSDGTDTGFDAEVSHTYFLRADATMQNSLNHYDWEAAYTTPTTDYSNRTYGEHKAPVSTSGGDSGSSTDGGSGNESETSSGGDSSDKEPSETSTDDHTYAHSDTATQDSITLTVQWDDPVLGEPTTFHVSATGGSGGYKYYMAAPAYASTGEWSFSSVPDPSRGEYTTYSDVCESMDFTFTMTASGTYFYKFYVMDMGNQPYKTLNTRTYVAVADDAHPSVATIVSGAAAQAKAATDGSEYEMALWLHDWLLDQLEYDSSLTWASAEAALTRHAGTCQAYTNAYIELLNAAGITNSETRDTYDGHTWNAVKLDGAWYQIDCTWDDNDDTKYYGFDARHLYFGLTDELMAVAHPGHAKICTVDGYSTRSTSLADNYYVKSGLAAQWADAYAARIQAKLNAKATSFSITSDNAYNPPSVIGIQNAVVAYAMNQRTWTTSDGTKVKLTASSKVTTESNTTWTAVYNFEATYEKTTTSIAAASVTAPNQTYTGSALTPSPTVILNGKTLKQGTDYTVSYANNVNVGTATITIIGKGNYTGSTKGTFKINAANASKATVKAANQTYTGKAFTPAPTVTFGGKTLKQGTDYTVAYANNKNVGTATVTVTFKGNYTGSAKGTFTIAEAAAPNVVYQAHVQNIGWQKAVKNGTTAGTSGRSLRVEAVKLWLENAAYSGGIQIRAHVQDIGWQDWSTTGGTSGKSLRVEAMQIRLTGELANHYDVYYRVHAQNFGWMGWAKNGQEAGSAGYAYRLEAVQIAIVKKGASAPGSTANTFRKPAMTVQYQAHVQNIGWQGVVSNGATAGTSGRSLRVEALNVSIANGDYDGGIQVRTHVQNIGWQGWGSSGGTSGRALRLEAMQIRLTGELANHYDVYYRVHAQNFGWMGWAKNGQEAGSAGYAYRLEAVQIKLVAKGGNAPGSTANRYRSK